jgi:hypothetical protein
MLSKDRRTMYTVVNTDLLADAFCKVSQYLLLKIDTCFA